MQQQTIEDLAEKEAEIKEAFEIFDKNKSKSISVQELTSVFRSLGYNFSQDEIQSMKVEGAEDKELNFDDFKNLLLMQEEKAKSGEDDLRDAFEVFDRDANGYIGLEELMMVAKSLGENISEEDLKANTSNQKDDDKDKAPQINLQQFVEAYLK
uniref:Calmodulin 2-1 n=1 Tax=Paramecium tetraurelia TaxID=5888 RepID=Q3SDV9_PARTE|nr:calmodulin 2-1 [Paramecium tetraurelia]